MDDANAFLHRGAAANDRANRLIAKSCNAQLDLALQLIELAHVHNHEGSRLRIAELARSMCERAPMILRQVQGVEQERVALAEKLALVEWRLRDILDV